MPTSRFGRVHAVIPAAATAACACALALGAAGPLLSAAAQPPASLKAIIEVDRDAYRAGDPVPVRISVWNDGTAPVEAPGGPVEASFEVYDENGQKIAPSGAGDAASAPEGGAAADAGAKPAARMLAPGAFVGFARDLTTLYPRLKQVGTYRLLWSAGGLVSNTVILRVVPRYDPNQDYTARFETDLGPVTIDLLRKEAPLTVRTFVDLASTGFYDGVIFHYVEPGRVVVAGDPTGTGHGGPGFAIPPERTQVKMLAGTVIMRPTGQPPANGSVFLILLTPRPDYEGTMTGFGQVTAGLEVVNKSSQVPAAPRSSPFPHRPLKDVRINRVVIMPKGA